MKPKKQGTTEELERRAGRKNPKSTNRGKSRLLFELDAPPGSEVFVAGNFNGWDPGKHQLSDKGSPGHFRRHVFVGPGVVEYKFVVDGEWHIDVDCPTWSPNGLGTLNSVVTVH